MVAMTMKWGDTYSTPVKSLVLIMTVFWESRRATGTDKAHLRPASPVGHRWPHVAIDSSSE